MGQQLATLLLQALRAQPDLNPFAIRDQTLDSLNTGEMSSEATAELFFEAVVRFYGLPDEALHDRDPRFTADFWRELWKLLGSRAVFSSAYHP